MNKEITLIAQARLNSSRIPQKMIKPFGNTTLFDITLDKLVKIKKAKDNPFKKVLVAINPKDYTLYYRTKKMNIEIINRNDNSIRQGEENASKILSYLKQVDSDYIMSLNCCMPFVNPNTYIRMAKWFKIHHYESQMPVVMSRNYYFDSKSKELLIKMNPQCTSTSLIDGVYKCIHTGFCFKKETVFKENRYWSLTINDPYLYRFKNSYEFLDIDEPWEFKLAESLYINL